MQRLPNKIRYNFNLYRNVLSDPLWRICLGIDLTETLLTLFFIITKICIAHKPDGKINRQIESEAHKNDDLTNV